MLRFASRPDSVFLAILHDALDVMIDQMSIAVENSEKDPTSWAESEPDLAVFFSPQLAKDTLSKLREASKAPSLYDLTAYHWYLLYMALHEQIGVHNDDLRLEPSELIPVGPYKVGKIDMDAIADRFFWDLDFGGGKVIEYLGGEARQLLTISDEAWSIAAGLPPHPDELTLQVWTGDPEWADDTEGYPESGVIATYPRDDPEDDP